MSSVRWMCRVKSWQPSKEQWLLAMRCVQDEEKQRIAKFVFQKDAKSALVGRLLIRKVIHQMLSLPYNEIQLSRTEKGKPYLTNPHTLVPRFNFNVSHQGEYAVLAAHTQAQTGVDVMRIEHPRGKSVEDFFETMNRQFTSQEWSCIKQPASELDRLKNFFRFWCLKESYVKAIGVGIGFSLQRLDFNVNSDLKSDGSCCLDTQLLIDGVLQSDWTFHEMMIDRDHCAAVASRQNDTERMDLEELVVPKDSRFHPVTIDELLENAIPVREADLQDWENFSRKSLQPALS